VSTAATGAQGLGRRAFPDPHLPPAVANLYSIVVRRCPQRERLLVGLFRADNDLALEWLVAQLALELFRDKPHVEPDQFQGRWI